MGPHFSPRGRSRAESRVSPGDIRGPNTNPSYGSLPIGTQFQHLTTPRACGTEAVQADSAWNLEAHHVISQARLQLSERIPQASLTRAQSRVWPWQAKTDPDRYPPLCPQPTPSGRPLSFCGFIVWSLLGSKLHPKPTLCQNPPPESQQSSKTNPLLEQPHCMGPHFRP